MHSETITHRRLWAWLLTAMFAPLAHFSGGSWLAVSIAGVIACSALALIPHYEGSVTDSRLLCFIEYVWALLILAQLVPLSAEYWPGRGSRLVIPGVLLLLAAYANANRPSRVAGVLFWGSALMLLPLMIAGVKDVEPRWLVPGDMDLAPLLIPTLLLPFAARLLPVQRKDGYGWYPWAILLAAGLCLITNGVLSHGVASRTQTPFRELSRALSIGSSSRFESLVGVLITVGWFSLYSLLLRLVNVLSFRAGITIREHSFVNALLVFVLSLLVKLPDTAVIAVTIIMWIILPLVHGKIKSKKLKKALDKRGGL